MTNRPDVFPGTDTVAVFCVATDSMLEAATYTHQLPLVRTLPISRSRIGAATKPIYVFRSSKLKPRKGYFMYTPTGDENNRRVIRNNTTDMNLSNTYRRRQNLKNSSGPS